MRLGLLMVGALVALACAGGFRPRSANPYEVGRDGQPPGATGGGGLEPVVAVASSVARRLDGQCYVPCLKGTACNVETGMCDALPCRGECKETERCDDSGLFPKCVPLAIDLEIERALKAPAP